MPSSPPVDFVPAGKYTFQGEDGEAAYESPLLDAHLERLEVLRRVMVSKQLDDVCKWSVTITVKDGKNTTVYPSVFPHTYAMYSESCNPTEEDSVSADFYVENPRHVVMRLDHLPNDEDVRDKAAAYWKVQYEGLKSKLEHLEEDRPDPLYGRPQLHSPPEPGTSCGLLMETELSAPIEFSNNTKFSVTVKGCKGTNNETLESDWVTGADLVKSAHENFRQRKMLMDLIKKNVKKAGSYGKVRVSQHPLLYTRECFAFDADHHATTPHATTPAMERILGGQEFSLPVGKCVLSTFRLVWKKSGPKRSLCLASTVVAFNFRRPENVCSDAVSECAICLEDVSEDDGVACQRCGKHVHHRCSLAWQAMCHREHAAVSCPSCRFEQ